MSKLPVGQHLVCIVKTEAKRNAKNTGGYLALTMECLSGAHMGKTFTDRLNVVHENEIAKGIANERLALYARVLAMDLKELSDGQQMRFRPFVVEVGQGKDNWQTVSDLHPMPTEWTDANRAAAVALCAEVASRGPTPPAPPANAQAGTAEAKSPNISGWGELGSQLARPHYVWQGVLQTGYLYALTATWGAGKTAIAIPLALHVAAGREFAGHATLPDDATERTKVLYLCGENPLDVAMRAKKAAEVFGIDDSDLDGQVFFTRHSFAIDNPQALAAFIAEAAPHGPFGLVIIDTGPAHSETDDEDDNPKAKEFAWAMRDLMTGLGNPATLALMHPAKGKYQADDKRPDSIEPRGGGGFSGEVDGLMCAWQNLGVTELYKHPRKWRGADFPDMCFNLVTHTVEGLPDNFGENAKTVVAIPLDSDEQAIAKTKPKALTGANLIAYEALLDMKPQADRPDAWLLQQEQCAFFAPAFVVHKDKWRDRCIAKGISSGNADAARKAFDRAYKFLLTNNKVQTAGGEVHWAFEWKRPKKEVLQPAAGKLL